MVLSPADLTEMVTQPFMRLVNADEKASDASIAMEFDHCPVRRQKSVVQVTLNQSR